MKISNKQSFNNSHFDFIRCHFNHNSFIRYLNNKNFMNLYKRFTVKSYSFLVIDITHESDNLLRFRNDVLRNLKINHVSGG